MGRDVNATVFLTDEMFKDFKNNFINNKSRLSPSTESSDEAINKQNVSVYKIY